MIHRIFFLIFLIIVYSSASSSSSSLSCKQESIGFSSHLPYPFGFNENSGIQLNCSVKGEIMIGEFAVKNVTNSHILIDFPENCDRSFDQLKNFQGKNFRVSSRNIFSLHGCQSPPVTKCLIPGSLFETLLGLKGCNGSENSDSCYTDDRALEFLDFEKVGNNCKFLLASIVAETINDDPGNSSETVVALDLNMVELVWWLVGKCSCDFNADCVIVNGTIDGYRCQCKDGFTGDGFTTGVGCHRGNQKDPKRKEVSWWILILTGFTIVIFVIAFTVSLRKYKKKKSHHVCHVLETNQFDLDTTRRISYYDLLRATENYSCSNLLGTGGFGSVYKGVLNDGEIVAVKVFKLEVQGAIRSFDVECEVLRSLRHRNLTKVITCCSNDKDFKALVLEYMPYGSLEKWLHSKSNLLDMLQRLNIMIDVTHALEYLHYGFSTPIVHCDIKPSNVLLDENMTARLCDFGLTRFLNEETSFTHTNTLATFGYIAPEYGSQGLVSLAGDVYSFGILLIETCTKKKPSDEMFKENVGLKEWVYNCFMNDQLAHVLDPDLLSNEQPTNQQMQSLSSIMQLALNCCADSPKERMYIKDVRVALEKIRLAHV